MITKAKDGFYDHSLLRRPSKGGLLHRRHPERGVQYFSVYDGLWYDNPGEDGMADIYTHDQWVSFEATKDDPMAEAGK